MEELWIRVDSKTIASTILTLVGAATIHLACRRSYSLVEECLQLSWLSLHQGRFAKSTQIYPWVTINSAAIVCCIPAAMTALVLAAKAATYVYGDAVASAERTQQRSRISAYVVTWLAVYIGGVGIGLALRDASICAPLVRWLLGKRSRIYVKFSRGLPKSNTYLPFIATHFDLHALLTALVGLYIADMYLPRPNFTGHNTWLWMNALSLGTIYLVTGYCLVVSFATSLTLLTAMCAWDAVFGLLLNTSGHVVTHLRAPIFVRVPKVWPNELNDTSGYNRDEFVSLASIDFMVLGMFMATIYRFGRVRRTSIYALLNTVGLCTGLGGTYSLSTIRQRPMPAMILPGVACVVLSSIMALARDELDLLWKFEEMF